MTEGLGEQCVVSGSKFSAKSATYLGSNKKNITFAETDVLRILRGEK